MAPIIPGPPKRSFCRNAIEFEPHQLAWTEGFHHFLRFFLGTATGIDEMNIRSRLRHIDQHPQNRAKTFIEKREAVHQVGDDHFVLRSHKERL